MIALEKGINMNGSSSVDTELKIHVPKSLKAKLVALQSPSLTENKKVTEKFKREVSVIPFAELKCNNLQEVYRVTKSFVKDVENENKKNFSFSAIGKVEIDLYLVTLASCLSYLRNNAHVCIVLEDMNSIELLKINSHFAKGTFGYCDTYEWGNLTILDYKQITKHAKLMKFDVSDFVNEFDTVVWQSPTEKTKKDLNETYVDIISKISSVTFMLNPNGQELSEILIEKKKFENLGLKLKGILYTRGKL